MQNALGSLRSKSKCVKIDESVSVWGIGSDNMILSGHFQFKVVKGGVSLCGVPLFASDRVYEVSDPVPPFPVFRTLFNDTKGGDVPIELKEFMAIIEVSTKHEIVPNIKELAPTYKSLWHPLQRIDSDINDSLMYNIPESWKTIELSHTRKFVVLGPKNSGKSSLCRFLANQHLVQFADKNISTYYLELDPGQPEFTTPGNISLHKCTEFNFSPAYAHATFSNCVKSCHLGYVSPMDTPHRYLEMCRHLIDVFSRVTKPQDHLIVNTPGWTKGLGLELNSEIAIMVGYERCEVIHIGQLEFDLNATEVESIAQSETPTAAITTITLGGFSAAELRNLQIMSYMHQCDTSAVTNWAPYELPIGLQSKTCISKRLQGFAIMDGAGIMLPEDLDICIEGTLVSINVIDENGPVMVEEDGYILPEQESNDIWRISNSVGLGIVQSFSKDSQTVRLLTPVHSGRLDLVNRSVILLRGRVQLPSWELTFNRQLKHALATVGADIPWVSSAKPAGIGSAYTKFRRNIVRNY